LVGNFDGALLDRHQFFHKAYPIGGQLKNMDIAFLTKFIALNLANNHSFDAGKDMFKRSVEMIRSLGIVPYGFKENPVAELKIGKNSVGIIGCLERSFSRPSHLFKEEEVLDLIRSLKGRYDFLFVTPHWGKTSEFTPFASPVNLRLAQQWIDAGASGVFGHRPHVLQGFSLYQERPIYPSLGNFSFSHPQCDLFPITRLGLGVEVSFKGKALQCRDRYFFDRKPLKNTLGAENYFNELSGLHYSTFGWMRLMGKTYIRKSFGSWKFRLWNARNVLDPIKFLVWLFLPSTLLMLLMSLFEKTRVLYVLERRFQKINP
jgi:hypothetical protein